MISFMKKVMGKDTKKLEFLEETQEMWNKYEDIHKRMYSVKLRLKPLLNMKDEIKLKEMPPMLKKYCKLKGSYQMIEV